MAKAKKQETTVAEETATPVETIGGAEFLEIALAKVRRSPTNPRKHFPEEAINEMAESIKAKGVLQPILVRPQHGELGEEYEIVAGECRYRASLLACMPTIPAIVRDLSDQEAMELQVLENLHRNNLTALEEAFGFKQLLDTGYTADELAEKINKSRTYVYDSLKLTELPEKAIEGFNAGKLNRSTALLVARLGSEDQDTAIEELVNRDENAPELSYRETKEKIDEIVQTSAQQREKAELLEKAKAITAELAAEGKTVILLDTKEKEQEWARYGFSHLSYNTQQGFTSPDRYAHSASLHDLQAFQIKEALSEAEYPQATYLVNPDAEIALVLHHDEAIALIRQKYEAGELSHLPLADKTPSPHQQKSMLREQSMEKARADRSTIFRVIFQKLSEKPLDQLPLRELLALQAQMMFENLSPDQYGIVLEVYGRQDQDEADFIREMTDTSQVAELVRFNFELLASMDMDPDYSWQEDKVIEPEILPVILKALDISEDQILGQSNGAEEKPKGKTKGKTKTAEAVPA
jgi:ParB/RepB/Spo0J family partition protein